jgi:hypothetical protein
MNQKGKFHHKADSAASPPLAASAKDTKDTKDTKVEKQR